MFFTSRSKEQIVDFSDEEVQVLVDLLETINPLPNKTMHSAVISLELFLRFNIIARKMWLAKKYIQSSCEWAKKNEITFADADGYDRTFDEIAKQKR
jgi:hypothetical protein